jgi:maltose alpha-D-glucosyltransferase/alpha-amylase
LTQRLAKQILPGYLPTCRWFGGKGRTLRDLSIVREVPIGSAMEAARLVIVEVSFVDGVPECYALLLAIADAAAGQRLMAETPHAVLARLDQERVLVDGLHLPEVRADLLRLMAQPAGSRRGVRVEGVKTGAFDPAELERGLAASRLWSAEQSNSSVAYADRWFFKFFRRFERGPQPDLEITRYLNAQGFEQVPAFAGALQLNDGEGEGTIGLLVGTTQNQGDGWGFTLDALARYFDRVLEARVELSPATAEELIGGVYPERARQLGQRTAELHVALAAGVERPDFAPEPFSTLYQRSLYQAMRSSAGRVLRQLRRQMERLPDACRLEAEAVMTNERLVLAQYARLLARKLTATKTRVHGDFHLGQVLNTGKDFVIIDFEGEPRRSLSERSLKRSSLVDVAGMLRSFDYAAAVALAREAEADVQRLEAWTRPWVETIWRAYLTGYLAVARGASFLPPEAADGRLLLEAFLLDKAIYEIGYELHYRPEFLPIPLRAVLRFLQSPHAGLETWDEAESPPEPAPIR